MPNSYVILAGLVLFFSVSDWISTDKKQRQILIWQWPLHCALWFLNNIVMLLMPLSLWQAGQWGQASGLSIVNLETGFWSVALWICAQSLVSYWVHYFHHRFRPLWAFHRVHHSTEFLDASTSFRHHPIESLVTLIGFSALASLLAPSLESLALSYVFFIVIDLFNHSRINLPNWVSHYLEYIIVTPRLHAVHHSPFAPQTDSNFGSTFTFWDVIFNTFKREIPLGTGLDSPSLQGSYSRDFDKLLVEPFFYLAGDKVKKHEVDKPPGTGNL